MSKTPGESRIPTLFGPRRPNTATSAAVGSGLTASRLPRGSVPGSPTTSSSSSLKGSAPGTPTAARRELRSRGATPDPGPEHGAAMPAVRQSLIGQGRVNKLSKSASASSTRAMAAGSAASSARPSRPTRPTSFPKPVVSEAAPRPVIDSTTRESSPASERPPESTAPAAEAVAAAVAAAARAHVWNPDCIEARHVGSRVQIAGEKLGTLRYFGPIALASGDFCGVELDEPDGKHDGTVRGVSYFRCAPQHGLLAPLHLVRLYDGGCSRGGSGGGSSGAPSEPVSPAQAALDQADSGPHSILDIDLLMGHDAQPQPQRQQHFDLNKGAFSSMASTPTSAALGDELLSPSSQFHGHLQAQQPPHFLHLMEKQNSFDLDESLGILTPDQMADGFTVCDGSSPEEEAAAAAATLDQHGECMEVDEHGPVDVHQVVEMVDSALRCTVGMDVDAHDDMLAQDGAASQADAAMDYLLSSRRDGALSASDCVSEASKTSGIVLARLDRTPSVEELPLDAQHHQPAGQGTPGQATPGQATPGQATPSRAARGGGKTPSSIITSVTSIASLDTGYQGDGEWSRPGSRGADPMTDSDRHSPTGHHHHHHHHHQPHPHHPGHPGIKIKGTAVDPMTDSDFFTESDADMQEERLGIAGHGGDRLAQVIDGTLYGGGAGNGGQGGAHHRPHPQHSEDMDSSGIYSDLERPAAPPPAAAPAANQGPLHFLEGRTLASLNQELVETLKNMLPAAEAESMEDRGAEDTGSMTSLVTVKSLQHQQQQQQQQQLPATAPAVAPSPKPRAIKEIKKYKMPNRNVTSKVKAMMVTVKPADEQENTAPAKRAHKSAPKKWEAVMQKIASNAEEQSSKLARLKDVKGKVLSSMGVSLQAPAPLSARGSRSASRTASRSNSITALNAARKGSALSSPRSADQRKAKSRRHRLEGPSPPSACVTPVMSPEQRSAVCSQASTPRSSLSDVSRASSANHRPPLRGSKKNRSSSPLSDASTNSTPRTKSATLPTPRATAHGGARERAARDKAAAENAEVLKKNQRNKTAVTPIMPRTDKAWSGSSNRVAAVAEKQAAAALKSPSPRKAATAQRRAAPLKDHNGRLEPKQGQQNGVSAAPLPARRSLGAGLRPSPQPQAPTPQEVAAELRKRLLPDLRHNAAAFEAMAVLLDYTTTKLGAFAAPALRRDLEKTKTDVASTVSQLEEVREQRRILERERDEEREARAELEERSKEQEAAAAEREQELQRRLAGHCDELDTLRAAHAGEVATLRGQMDARALEAADAVAAATRGLREEYELELDRVTRRHEETLRAALGAARAEAEREAAQRDQEAARREAELAAQLAARGAAHEALREQSRRVMDSMKSDKDARTQALAARCRELQDEVDSLRSVLELRCDELQKSRRENDALRIAADQLAGAEQRVSTLTARLEDLQVQLDRKGELESRLVQENSELHQSFSKEIKEKQMLSLQNEQLQFKLKQNTEVVNALAANMSDFHDVSAIMNASMNGLNLPQDRSRRSTKSNNNNNRGVVSPPESPRVKGVVEKSESVSYMLEMEADSTDEVVSRIYRRMASTPLASPAHAPHPRSAPPSTRRAHPLAGVQAGAQAGAQPQQMCPLAQSASATAISSPTRPTPKQRTTSATLRVRSRSISSDSGECLSSGNWSPPASLPPSQQQQRLQRRSPDVVDEGLLAPSSGIGYDCSDIEDFSSSKSSSMSCSSESSELGGAKEHDHHHQEEEDDDVEQPMFQHQQDRQDLMTASCGSVTLPQDAGGEAMICSEEMNEDEVSANGLHSSCEEDASCSEDDDSRGAAGAGRARAGLAGLPRLSLPMTPTAGCGQSAINTPMDSSWSEDMELPVSLSETS